MIGEIIEDKEENDKCIYDLYGVVNHSGGVGFGHCYSYAKNRSTNKWYEYNDSSVTELNDLSDIVSSKAYVLFYEKRDTDVYNIYHTLNEKE